MLIILTAVEKVAVNFGKENEKWLDDMTVEEAQKYVEEGQFAPGSMLPKKQKTVSRAKPVPRFIFNPKGQRPQKHFPSSPLLLWPF